MDANSSAEGVRRHVHETEIEFTTQFTSATRACRRRASGSARWRRASGSAWRRRSSGSSITSRAMATAASPRRARRGRWGRRPGSRSISAQAVAARAVAARTRGARRRSRELLAARARAQLEATLTGGHRLRRVNALYSYVTNDSYASRLI